MSKKKKPKHCKSEELRRQAFAYSKARADARRFMDAPKFIRKKEG